MRKVFCDRCGNEMKIAFINIYIGSRDRTGLEICEPCTDALYRFMGVNTQSGYEKLDSEVAEQ